MGITEREFTAIGPPLSLSPKDRDDGFVGPFLSYGFGDDGQGNADAVLSVRLAWAYARRLRSSGTWQCQYIDFDNSDHFRLRPLSPPSPRGYYYTNFQPGDNFSSLTAAKFLKSLAGDTGCGPEGIQLLTITHYHLAELMNQRKIAFMAFADHVVAPYCFHAYFDAVQMFCSDNKRGLGIGDIDRNSRCSEYPH